MSDLPTLLDEKTGGDLVHIARCSLELFFRDAEQYQPDLSPLPALLQAPGSSFVTLTNQGELRGCIGTTEARLPLAKDVARNAVSAATLDRRFPMVTAVELNHIRLEVTILTPSHPLNYPDYLTLLTLLHPGRDGVILSWRRRRGLLLPQVWHRISDPGEFLSIILQKAKIPPAELEKTPPTVVVETFRVQHFQEPGYREPGG